MVVVLLLTISYAGNPGMNHAVTSDSELSNDPADKVVALLLTSGGGQPQQQGQGHLPDHAVQSSAWWQCCVQART